jgi:glycerol-1-phosphate dehydrogenase [NAD(P)+]
LLRIKPNALYKLGKYLRKNGFDRVALFYGQGMADLVGKNVAISLESSEIQVVVERTIADNDVAGVVSGALTLPRGVQAVVAVGGGVALDVGKYAGFLTRLPVVAVPTAVSNDGFCSPGASLMVDGRRVSCPATIPFGVVIDTAVVAGSPARFTYSGIGDLLSKFSAIADWKLAYHQTGETINDFAVMISLQSVQNLVTHAEKSVDDQRFLQLMCGALVMSGVAMEVAGSSRPASGSEHLISHAYDELAPKPSLHGLQVAVATLATTWLQGNPEHGTVLRVLTETGVAAHLAENRLDRSAFVEAVRVAPTVKPGYHTVLSSLEARDRLCEHLGSDPFWNAFLA